jgi:hypothetical protein
MLVSNRKIWMMWLVTRTVYDTMPCNRLLGDIIIGSVYS